MKLLSWLADGWRIVTIPAHKRCSFCTRVAEVFEALTTADGGLTRVITVRYCGDHHQPAAAEPCCETCGLPWSPSKRKVGG